MSAGRQCATCGEFVMQGAEIHPLDDPSKKVFLCGKCLPKYVTPAGEPLMTEDEKEDQQAIAITLKIAAEGYVNGWRACIQAIESRPKMEPDDLLRWLKKEIENAKLEDMVELMPDGDLH